MISSTLSRAFNKPSGMRNRQGAHQHTPSGFPFNFTEAITCTVPSESDIEAKWKECDALFTELEANYKDDEEKLKEFNEAGEACSKEMEKEMDAAMEKWEAAQEGGEE